MFILATMLSFLASILLFATLTSTNDIPREELREDAEIMNMRIYDSAVRSLVNANPAFVGNVTTALVTPYLPTYYAGLRPWQAVVVAGAPKASFTWGTTTLGAGNAGASALSESSKYSRLVGYSTAAGAFWSPVYGAMPGVVLPGAVTANSLVIVNYY